MDEWLKGVIAGSAAVLISTALSMRTTEKLIKEAEIDFANPEFGVTPAEDFTDSPRQNLAVGGYTFNAESPSGDDPMMADPTEEGGPAELFDESVVQDEQDGGVDFMNAETHTYKELTLENLPKDSLINMIESSSDLIIFYGDKEDLEDFDEENFGTVGEYYQEFIDGANRSRQKFPDAYAYQKNAESPLEESPLTADPLTADPSDMGGPEEFSADEDHYGPNPHLCSECANDEKEVPAVIRVADISGYHHGGTDAVSVKTESGWEMTEPIEAYTIAGIKDMADDSSEKIGYCKDCWIKEMSGAGNAADVMNKKLFGAENYSSKDARRAHYIRRMQGYNDKQDESLGMRHRGKHQQSMKDRRDEASAMDKGHSMMGRKYDDVMTMDAQGYNDKMDESLGMRHRGSHSQSMKDRRDEASAMDKDHSMMHRKYDDVMTMDAQGYNDKMDESLGMRHRGKHQQSMKDRRDEASAMDKMHSKMGRKYDDVMTMDAEARRWRLPKTSKGTALYAKRDKSGKFTDIQNVARSTRADRARIAANQGVKSGQGDEGERMIYNAEFTNLTDHISTMYAAESEDLILCAHCDKKMSECGEHYTETYEASSSYNPYPVFMKPKDAAAVFAKNKNKLCTVTFVKKDGSMRTMKGRTGVFRDKSGKTIVGTGKKPSWSAKARADAGYMTFFDIDAARKAGDNRKGFRMINLNTISSIKAMGRKFDGAHPKGF